MPDAKHPHLPKAPIAEAVVEFRVTGHPAPSEEFERFAVALGSGYPKHMKLQEATALLRFGEADTHADSSVSRIGVRLESADDKDIVIGSVRSLVVSRLAPYQSWDVLIEKIRMAWPIYREHFKPEQVIRMGVRCINRIDIGEEKVDLDAIFQAGPQIPPDLPQHLGQYMTRVVLPVDFHMGIAITQSLEPGSRDAVLDIDAYAELAANPADDHTLWDQLEKLHDQRNRAFFASLHKTVWEKYL